MTESKWDKKCRKCGERYYAFAWSGDKFCTSCGNKLPKPPKDDRCSCGCAIGEKDRYCFGCGKKIARKTKKVKAKNAK